MVDKPRLDYNLIAEVYDRRYTVSSMDGAGEFLRQVADSSGATAMLEVGCGTGRWLNELHQPRRLLAGVDLSSGMLKQAREKMPLVSLMCGHASHLPFTSNSFDLVYCVNAIHHFDDPAEFISEALRVVRRGGALVVIGMTPHGRRDRWYVYEYFPGTYEIDIGRFPPWGSLLNWMVAAGCSQVSWQPLFQIVEHRQGRAILDDPFLDKRATSQLALLSDEAYKAGVRRIENAVKQSGEDARFSVDIAIDCILAKK